MSVRTWIEQWPVYRQVTGDDRLALGAASRSRTTALQQPRTATADRVVKSICPYCAVGCATDVYVKDDKVVQIEGDPHSPISRGRLCPKGSATLQLTTGEQRLHQVLYRRPHGTSWEELDLQTALEMVADRVVQTRAETFEWESDGKRTRRTLGIASLGGAALDNEENYLIKKLWTALGIVQVENQARVCHSSTVAGLGTSFGRGGSTMFMQDLQNSDCIVIQGSNYAEAHPVGFQWVMEAKARGATVIHVDPRFTRTSALADVHVPIRAGTDIAFLGGLINHVLTNELDFREFVLTHTNASTLLREDFRDTEDLDGVFSGLDEGTGQYDPTSWGYEGVEEKGSVGASSASPDAGSDGGGTEEGSSVHSSGRGETHGSGGPSIGEGEPHRDETLQHPRCVYQVVKRHYARYTPEMVSETCGIPPQLFAQVCDALVRNSGRDRTSAFAYAVGWTQHTVGAQYIRACCILQLLLGNVGRPGGGVQALRGHASIQGSSDIPTLYNLLPGYLPMPHAEQNLDLDSYVEAEAAERGFWGNMKSYAVSLLKAYWGDAATADNDFCFDYLPRLTGSHGTYETVKEQIEGVCRGYFLMGENPAVGSSNAKLQRKGLANLDWLVIRDFTLIESATWWKDGPELATGEMRTEDIGTEVFFFPASAVTEKSGTFTNTNRLLQWHHRAQEPAGDCRSDLWFMYHLGRLVRERLAASTDERDRPVLDLTWDYPVEGPHDEPSAEAVLQEINGYDGKGDPLSAYTQLKDDGSTSCGCWIYCGVYADGINQAARRKPASEQDWVAADWAWAWPANRRTLYNRASADAEGNPWSERKAYVWWDADAKTWTGHDVPDIQADKPPSYRPPKDARGPDALSGTDAFIMQADGKGWLFTPAGLLDGPLPTHYEPQDSPVENPLYGQQRNPTRSLIKDPQNMLHPDPGTPGADVFPFVLTTYRLVEHFTGGGMSRTLPYLSELQPELFIEVSPELAAERGLEHLGWATVVTARNAIEAKVLVTERMTPLKLGKRVVHQIGMPWHYGPNGLAHGDTPNELTSASLDPNVHIQEDKALSADIQPGRRPRGRDLPPYVQEYRRRAGVTDETGRAVRS